MTTMHSLVFWIIFPIILISAVTFIYGMVQLARKDRQAGSTLNIGFGVGICGMILLAILVNVVT